MIPKEFKKFHTMDSLWYEEERLATFIDWPVMFIQPAELAADGFYYLRIKDHCACIFCRGIIGAWDQGDTPRGEHRRHFPRCPFVLGHATGNIPILHGKILARLPSVQLDKSYSEDICGNGRPSYHQEHINASKSDALRKCLDSIPDTISMLKKDSMDLSMGKFGLRQYSGPKRKEFLTFESRHQTFARWPEKVKQTPRDLAEAGFYYFGVSDHVCCFHCNNGLRNWEDNDVPWEEHARWYPDCHFVILKKGIQFIDKIRRERPPYSPVPSTSNISNPEAGSTQSRASLTEEEMDQLMELEVIEAVLQMGFPKPVVRRVFRKKLETTGLPFFNLESCIEAVLQEIEEESHRAPEEASMLQRRKLENITSLPVEGDTTGHLVERTSLDTSISSSELSSLPSLPNNNLNASIDVTGLRPLPSSRNSSPGLTESTTVMLPALSIASPPLRSSTPTFQVESVLSQPMDVENESSNSHDYSSTSISQNNLNRTIDSDSLAEQLSFSSSSNNSGSTNNVNTEAVEDIDVAPSTRLSGSIELESQDVAVVSDNDSEAGPLLNEADTVMEEAAKLLGPKSLSSSSCEDKPRVNSLDTPSTSQEFGSSGASNTESSGNSPIKNELCEEEVGECQDERKEDIAEELERLKECRTCRVCMDSEIDIVFLPCTHMVACSSCAVALTACPICRRDIQYAFKPIIS